MADAVLSDGQEELSVSSCSNGSICGRTVLMSKCSHQLVTNSCKCNLIQKSTMTSLSPTVSSKLLLSGDEKYQKQQKYSNKKCEIDQEMLKVKQQQHTNENSENISNVQKSLMFISKNRISQINQNTSGCSGIGGGSGGGMICSGTSNVEKQIPTAIVKPKYQKFSYDDRQLPPIGIGFNNTNSNLKNTWYSNISSSSSINNNDRSLRKIHQYDGSDHIVSLTDRNSTKYTTKKFITSRCNVLQSRDKLITTITPIITTTATTSSSSSTNSRHYSDIRMTDNDGNTSNCNNSVIAIVTPRKKDKMEMKNDKSEKCFNENIVDIEKNNNNNGNNNNCVVNGNTNNNNNSNNNNLTDIKRHDINKDNKKDYTTTASFDVYNIETALPVIDLEAIENHLKKAKEEERKRRNDREEIRRRLAMGAEDDYFSKIVTTAADRPGRKPSLQSRLQSGMNLQICFMNEASSDTESPSSDSETCPKLSKSITKTNQYSLPSRYSSSSLNSAHPYNSRPLSVSISNNNINRKSSYSSSSPSSSSSTSSSSSHNRPSSLSLGPPIPEVNDDESDFFTKQARLQIEARMALAQAKDMAHMQMEIERQKQKQSPITEVIRNSLEKVGVPFPPEKRRVSRQMLTDMNIAQLQIIVNELHTQIERLNERLVQYLMERDDLHMSQDSMLVDIEDLTRYLGAKEQSRVDEKVNENTLTTTTTANSSNKNIFSTKLLDKQQQQLRSTTTTSTTTSQTQSKFQRIANLVKK